MKKIAPVLMGIGIFILTNFGWKLFQNSFLYLDGLIIKIIFTLFVGLLYLKVFKYTLNTKEIFIASITVYIGQAIVRILKQIASADGDSMAKMFFTGFFVELLTLATVTITLLALVSITNKNSKD